MRSEAVRTQPDEPEPEPASPNADALDEFEGTRPDTLKEAWK